MKFCFGEVSSARLHTGAGWPLGLMPLGHVRGCLGEVVSELTSARLLWGGVDPEEEEDAFQRLELPPPSPTSSTELESSSTEIEPDSVVGPIALADVSVFISLGR